MAGKKSPLSRDSSTEHCPVCTIQSAGKESPGRTRIHVAIAGKLIATVYFEDCIRHEAKRTIETLSAMQKTVWMVTGDHSEAARMVARQVGISDCNIVSNASIEYKAQIITDLQKQGRVVAFCGDGPNDVLALVTADVGISIIGSTDAAMASASVIISGQESLRKIFASLKLANDICRKIKFNLCYALVWNILVLPLAMGLLLPWDIYLSPVTACLVMSLSCISVIGSSLCLSLWQTSKYKQL